DMVPEGHRPGDGPHYRPAGPPPPLPAGAADVPDPADARLVYDQTAPPDLNHLPGSMRSVHVARRFPAPMVIRWVQNRLIRHQHGLIPATAFLNGPIPLGTPFRFHNPFTARAQCHEVGYQEPEHIPPLGVLQAHADNRGWRGVVLLNPQPDSAAVHLIALPQYAHLASVALLVDNRIVPCCVPRRARWRELRSITFEGVRGRLDLPPHVDVVQDVVTFRSGDCFRVDTAEDHTPASEYARLEDVDHETAEAQIQGTLGGSSGGKRHSPRLWGLLCVLLCLLRPGVSWWWLAGLSLSAAMHRPGSFPWQLPAHERSFRLPNSDGAIQVIYYSPFVGNFPPYQTDPGTDHSVAWAQFLNDDAAWAVDFFPVWPGPHFNALAFVPVGGDSSTVTAILHYRGFARATLMPRTVTDAWMQSFASHQVSADIESIHLPHALEIWRFYDVPPPDCRLRNGDVIYLHDRDRCQDPLEFEASWDIQTSGTGQHAPWAVGFRLDSDTVVDLLRPGHRPTLVTIPAGETWAPVQCTFSGDFHLQHPGMWTPVQWTASSIPQLMLANGVAAYANVVVATTAGRRVRSVPRYVDREALASCTDLHRSSLTLGGITSSALDAGVEIRNGDVVFGDPLSSSAAPWCYRSCCSLWLILSGTLGWVGRGWSPAIVSRGAGDGEAPSPDSEEEPIAEPTILPGGGLQVRAMCPFAGCGPSREITHDAVWSIFAGAGSSLCGSWPCAFFPGRGLGHRDGLTLLPASPPPLVTVVLHRQGSARPLVVPESVTLAQLHLLSGVRAVHVMCIEYDQDEVRCQNAFLPGPFSHHPPHGWQWHPGIASLQPSALRTGDVLVPDPSVEGRFDPWTQSIQMFVPPVVAGALMSRGGLWCVMLLLACSAPRVDAMQQPLAFSFNAFRVGRFPWREHHQTADLTSLSTQDSIDTVYLSPFSGPGPVVTLPAASSVADWSEALLQQDPAWGASACPVWPTVSAGAMIAVPRPPSLDLVCVHVTSHLEHFAICIPRVTTIAWVVGALRNARALDVLSLRIPPALGQSPGDSQDEVSWRTGDLLVALPPDAFTGLFQTPVFSRAEQLRHCAIWSLDFWL
ncbi:unnamed protein product, partial [Symbiodinium necroappetens]